MADAFEPPYPLEGALNEASMHGLARYVGASWCRIVRDDVRYRILHGLELVEESEPLARKLVEWVLRPKRPGRGEPADIEFTAYAAARWCDGAAKIHFRLGDFLTKMRA